MAPSKAKRATRNIGGDEMDIASLRDRTRELFLAAFPRSSEMADEFSQSCRFDSYAKGETIKRAGAKERWISLVLEGCAASFVMREKRRICLDIVLPGGFAFDFASLVSGVSGEASVQALEPCLAARMLYPPATGKPNLKREELMRSATTLFFLDRQARLVSLLSKAPAERYRELEECNPDYPRRIPVAVLASWLGITREHLSRIRAGARM